MNVVLVHPVHGAKVATLQAEVDQDLEQGWKIFTPESVTETEPVVESKSRKSKSASADVPSFMVPKDE